MKKKRLAKKGISPLIATVLLIGFTVAIVALVIIWGRSYTEEKAQKEEAFAMARLTCENVDFTVTSATWDGTNKMISLGIKNRGSTSIDSFVFRVNGGGAVIEAGDVVGGMETKIVNVDASAHDIGTVDKVEVIPKVSVVRGVYMPCSTKSKNVIKIVPA